MLAAHPSPSGAVLLSWQEDVDNEEGFIVERSIDGRTWTRVGLAMANSTEFVDGALEEGRLYFYRVGATNMAGKSRYSNIASGSTVRIASIVPVGSDGVRLSFTAQAGHAYTIQFRNSLANGTWQDLVNVPAEAAARLYMFTDSLPAGTRARFYRLIIP
jgi:hypothetical protein